MKIPSALGKLLVVIIVLVFLGVFTLIGLSGMMALFRYPVHVGIGVAVLIAAFLANQTRLKRERKRVKGLVDSAFWNVYAQLPLQPSIEMFRTWGVPSLKIEFISKSELEAAAGLNEQFKIEIGKVFKDYGSKWNSFDADKAMDFTYEGYLDDFISRLKTTTEQGPGQQSPASPESKSE